MRPPLYDPELFLKPKTLALKDVLGREFFEVPAYQRDYSWTDNDVRLLWSDLLELVKRNWLDNGSPVEAPRPHFFGPIVIQPQEGSEETLEVMDGQQRLVTFSALLAVLSEHAEELSNDEDRHNWTRTLEQLLFVFEDGEKRPRVKLARSDTHFKALFCDRSTKAERESYMRGAQDRRDSSFKAMCKAYRLLGQVVEEELGEAEDPYAREPVGRLIRVIRTVIDLSLFLQMEVKAPGVAYEIFEGLNGRGLELSQADLVKNKLFALAESQGDLDQVQHDWEATFIAIQNQDTLDLPTFLQFYHLVRVGPVKAARLYDTVCATTLKHEASAREYAARLREAAERVQLTMDAGAGFTEAATRDIEHIRDSLKNKYALTLIIASAGKIQVRTGDYDTLLRIAHHFAYRRFVVGDASVTVYAAEVVAASKKLVETGDVGEVAALLSTKSPDAAFRMDFAERVAATSREGFYACEMIERYLGADAGVVPKRQSPSQHLEHIFPKQPASNEWPDVSTEEHGKYLNRIGNLLILERNINSAIGNRSFAFKREKYITSSMKLPRQVSKSNTSWTISNIKKRQKGLAEKYAAAVWDLETGG